MKIETIFYLIGQGIQNIFKNRLISIATITTIAMSIFVVATFSAISMNIDYMLEKAENKMGITVFFNEGTEEKRELEIKSILEKRTDVYEVEYISADQAWESFKESNFKGREEQLAGYEGENPLIGSESLVVYFEDIDTSSALVEYISSLPDVRKVEQDQFFVSLMDETKRFLSIFSIILTAVLLLMSLFLISNTIKLGISTRQKEIQIMKYIGATDSFIRGPFIIEGIIIGLLGTILPIVLLVVFYTETIVAIGEKFVFMSDVIVFMPIGDLLLRIMPLVLITSILIGFLGSILTVNRYLKV